MRLTNPIVRWLSRRLRSAEVDRLRRENAELRLDLEAVRLQLQTAYAKLKAMDEESAFYGQLVARMREQVKAEQAVTSRQIATGEVQTVRKP